MLSIPGRPGRTCDGYSRRELLRVGGAGLLGLSLPNFLSWRAHAETKIEPLVSGYKSNRFNWLEIPSDFSWDSVSSKACRMGAFSKSVTLRTCRIW